MDAKTKKNLGIGCGLGCGGLLLLSALGAYSLMKSPEDITIHVSAPLNAAKGEAFEIAVEIENTSDEPQTLDSIDIADEYGAGIAVGDSDPPFRTSMHVPIDDSQSYEYKKPIPAKGKLTVKFQATPVKAGDFAGDLDVCVNSPGNFLTYPVRTIVSP